MADRSGYIGRAPGDSSVIIARQTFEPTGVQTNFTFTSGYTVGYLDVYINGGIAVRHILADVVKQNYGDTHINYGGGYNGLLSDLWWFACMLFTRVQHLITH